MNRNYIAMFPRYIHYDDSDDGLVMREEKIAWLPVMIDRSALMEMINGVDPLETISE